MDERQLKVFQCRYRHPYHCFSAGLNNIAAPRHENLEHTMGATISINKKVAGFARSNGEIVYITFEETCSKRDDPRTPYWNARAIGSYDEVMRLVFSSASATEGGSLQTRSGSTSPEAYIQRWRDEFKAPIPMPNLSIQLKLGGTSMYSSIEDKDVDDALAALEKLGRQDLVEALRAGPVTLSLHDDVDVILALYGVHAKLSLWKVVSGGPPCDRGADWLAPAKRKAPVMAPTVDAYRIDERNVVVSIGGAPYQSMGYDYNAVAMYMEHVVLPLELRCDGAARKMIGAFRDKLSAAPQLPNSTTLTVTPAASGHRYHIENAAKLAVKLGVADTKDTAPATYKVTFGDVKAAEEVYLLSTLEAGQVQWTLALYDDVADATLLSNPVPSYSEQAQLF